MIESSEFYNAYEKFYKSFRNYVWDFDTVTKLAELEIELFCAFPDKEACANKLELLISDIKRCNVDDEDLKKSYEALLDLLNSDDTVYTYIEQV